MYRAFVCVVVGAAIGWVSGCRDKAAEQPSPGQEGLLLFCGAGIRPPVAELAEVFERETGAPMITDYAGSEMLLSKIKLSRRGDLYVPGDKHYVDQAAEEGMIRARKPVCYFVPTILVQKENPKKIAGLADLIRPGVKLGLGDSRACAIGRTSKKIFEKNDIRWADVEKNLSFQSLTVNELGMQIQAESLDAAIVWDAIAHYYAAHAEAVPIPAQQNVISTVEVGILEFTENEELARKFVDFAASERGRAVFEKHNYRVAPPGKKVGP